MKKLFSGVAEISVSYKPYISDKPIVMSALDAYNVFFDFFPLETIGLQEIFLVMYLNNASRVLGVYKVSTGGITGTIVDLKLILSVGLKIVASGIMLAHNHPSGSLKPSHQDILVTNKIKDAAKVLDIKLLDHLIVSPEKGSYISLANEGML